MAIFCVELCRGWCLLVVLAGVCVSRNYAGVVLVSCSSWRVCESELCRGGVC